VDFFEVVGRRKTTNGSFSPDPISLEHQRLLVDVAARAPSHFNSQPWRFVLIDDRRIISEIARISGASMRQTFEEGTFWKRYRRYFRMSAREMDEKRDGMLFDQLPRAVRPFKGQLFSPAAQLLMNRLGIPRTLAEDNRKLVAGSPLLLAALLDREEYRSGELSGFYSVFGLGAAIENVWLATAALGMGIQFISFPMEVPAYWAEVGRLLEVPEGLELMALYRLGYAPPEEKRNRIDWTSRQRKRASQYVFRNTCATPEPDNV